MLLYFLIVLGALVVIITFVRILDEDDFLWALGGSILAALAAGLGGCLILLAGYAFAASTGWGVENKSETQTNALASVGANQQVQGRSYFLGGGYIGERRVLNYIVRYGDGSSKLYSADADASIIFEDAEDRPVVKTTATWKVIPWLLPGEGADTSKDYTYEFHIPAGSVQTDYSITN